MTDTDNLSRRRFLKGTGVAATSVALAGCNSGGDEDTETTEDSGGTTEDTGGTTEDSNGNGNGSEFATPADKAQAAWDFITENTGPEAQEERNQRYVDMEEAAREAAVWHPQTHDKTRRYWYDVADVPKTGVLGARYMQHNETTVDRSDNELNIQSATFGVLDPIRSTDVYSGRVLHQIGRAHV